MPREVLGLNGTLESLENVSARERRYRAEQLRPDARWSMDEREFESMLGVVDFYLLENVFIAVAERCGISRENMNFRERADILQTDNVFSLGFYILESNVIFLQGDNLRIYAQHLLEAFPLGSKVNLEFLQKVCVLKTLIHEEVHALSYAKFERWRREMTPRNDNVRRGNATPGMYMKKQSGYHTREFASVPNEPLFTEGKSAFLVFDEGVTEKIADELLRKYLEADDSSDPAMIREYFSFQESPSRVPADYDELVALIDTVVEVIAKRAGFSPETVWQAIVRSKLEGVDLEDSELREFFDEHTFQGFIDQYERLGGNIHSVRSCIQDLEKTFA